ncbi:MAG: HEPN domain-containing protein [Candidatus Moranbacteria bacterium]|nr:HEPN domain-containing protein [Candidatus Moranbacteria bacterium]
MKPDKNKKRAGGWFRVGGEDLDFAKASLREFGAYYPQVCFLCQQAAEKYLKGYLVFRKGKFPKVYDLTHLLKLCAKADKKFLDFLSDGDILSQYYIVARYPLPEYPLAGKAEAKEALASAEKIVKFVKKSAK